MGGNPKPSKWLKLYDFRMVKKGQKVEGTTEGKLFVPTNDRWIEFEKVWREF